MRIKRPRRAAIRSHPPSVQHARSRKSAPTRTQSAYRCTACARSSPNWLRSCVTPVARPAHWSTRQPSTSRRPRPLYSAAPSSSSNKWLCSQKPNTADPTMYMTRKEKSARRLQELQARIPITVAAALAFAAWAALPVLGQQAAPPADRADASQPESDPPTRAARLSYIEGSVSLQPAGVEDWNAAPLNQPLTLGDALWSD